MSHALTRIQPALRPDQYRTFAVSAPLATHFVAASCEDVDCPAFVGGWRTTLDLSTELGQAQAHFIRRDSGRGYSEPVPGVFEFTPGQACFQAASHRRRADRPELFLVRDGDWRTPRAPVERMTAESWVSRFREHQDRLATALGQ